MPTQPSFLPVSSMPAPGMQPGNPIWNNPSPWVVGNVPPQWLGQNGMVPPAVTPAPLFPPMFPPTPPAFPDATNPQWPWNPNPGANQNVANNNPPPAQPPAPQQPWGGAQVPPPFMPGPQPGAPQPVQPPAPPTMPGVWQDGLWVSMPTMPANNPISMPNPNASAIGQSNSLPPMPGGGFFGSLGGSLGQSLSSLASAIPTMPSSPTASSPPTPAPTAQNIASQFGPSPRARQPSALPRSLDPRFTNSGPLSLRGAM